MSVSRSLRNTCAAAVLLTACSVQTRTPAGAADEHSSHMSAADKAAPGMSQRTEQGTPGLPASNTTAAARLAASPRHAEWVKIAWEPGSKDSLMAWVVYPSTTRARTPVVVVIHEIFGLSTWVRGVADQVAADGFIAIAPDLVSRVRGGPSTTELTGDSARKIIGGVNTAERNRGINAAANYGMSLASADQKFGVIGYCWGGSATWGAAVHNAKGFGGGVAFYGSPYTAPAVQGTPARPNADSLAKIMMPVMLLNGSKDMRIGAMMPAIDSIMKARGKAYAGINYPGAIHGFLRAQDDARAPRDSTETLATVQVERDANLAAARDGWPKTIAFLKKNLGLN